MFRSVVLAVLAFVLSACTSLKDQPDNPQYAKISQTFFNNYWALHPLLASEHGLSQYDDQLEVLDSDLIGKRMEFYRDQLKMLSAVEQNELSVRQRIDHSILINEMKKSIWNYEKFKEYQWNPSLYNIGPGVGYVLQKQGRPLGDRLKDLSKKLLKVNQYYQAAKNNVQRPTTEHINLAITQTQGLRNYLGDDVLPLVKGSSLSRTDKSSLRQRLQAARTAAQRYINFLKGIKRQPQKVGGLRDFRIGKELYADMFKFRLAIDQSPEQLYKAALSAKADIQSKIFEAAIGLYPKYFGERLPPKDRREVITSVLNKVIKKNPAPKNFIDAVRGQIPDLAKFVTEKKLLSLDPKMPLVVRPTPLYRRGAIGISIDPPRFFESDSTTYYNVTPLASLTSSQRRSFLREYNVFTTQILNMHEAIPGHYAQLVYASKVKSPVSNVFSNEPFVEGWASYSERMMLEEGYGKETPELWLMYYKWHLRAVTNTILDYEVHVKNLSKKAAMKLLVKDAYQEKTEANSKWNRAQVTQVQLASYFAGYSEIYKLREQLKEEQGDDFTLLKFHEELLSYGRSPLRQIRKAMLD